MNAEPQCLWATGVITTYWTALPETEYMKLTSVKHALNMQRKSTSMDWPPKSGLVHMQDGECGHQIM
eukprot:12594611-Heterocapsa_arctica.AAC.1